MNVTEVARLRSSPRPCSMLWSCAACTYENVNGARTCEMCGTSPIFRNPAPRRAVNWLPSRGTVVLLLILVLIGPGLLGIVWILSWRIIPLFLLGGALRASQMPFGRSALLITCVAILSVVFRSGLEAEQTPPYSMASAPTVPRLPPPPLPPPSPPTLPSSCFMACILRFVGPMGNTSMTDKQSKLREALGAAAEVPSALRAASHDALVWFGPQGTFARDAWPVLVLSGLIAIVSLISVSWPVLVVVLRPVLVGMRAAARRLQRAIRPLTTLSLVAMAAAIAEDAWLSYAAQTAQYLRFTAHVVPGGAPLIWLALLVARGPSPTEPISRSQAVGSMASATLLVGAGVGALVALALCLTAQQLHGGQQEEAVTRRPALQVGHMLARLFNRTLSTGHSTVRDECPQLHRRCLLAVQVASALSAWLSLSLLGVATGSRQLLWWVYAPIRLAANMLRVVYRQMLSLAPVLQIIAMRCVVAPTGSLIRLSIRRWRTLAGLLLGTLSGAGLRAQLGAAWPAPAALIAECASAGSLIGAALYWAPLPLRLFVRVSSLYGTTCAASFARTLVALLCAAGSTELFLRDLLLVLGRPAPLLREARLPFSAPVQALRRLISTPPAASVHLVRDGICPAALGFLLLRLAFGEPPICCGPAEYPALSQEHDTLIARLFEGAIGAVVLLAGATVCWHSEVLVAKAAKAFCIRAVAAASERARAAAGHGLSLLRVVIHAVQCDLLRLWDAIHTCWRAVSSATWRTLIRPATRLCCAAGGACSRVLASIGRAIWRWLAGGLQTLRRGIRTIARHGASVAMICIRAVRRWLARAGGACAAAARRLRVHVLVPLARAIRDGLLVPVAHTVLKPLATMAARHWPLLSCGFALMSAALFTRAAALFTRAAALELNATGHRHLQSAGVLGAITPALTPALNVLSSALGAWATGSVGLLLAGYSLGRPGLQAWGAWGIRHVDLGVSSLLGSIGLAASQMLVLLVRFVSERLHTLHQLARHVVLGALGFLHRVFGVVFHLAMLLFRRVMNVVILVFDRLVLHPLQVIWHSPMASLFLSALLATAAYAIHRSGIWAPLVGLVAAFPSLAQGVASVVTSQMTHVATRAAAVARLAAAIIAGPARSVVPSVAATVSRGVLAAAEEQMAALESSFASAGQLHAQPAFSLAIWLLFVVIVKASPILPPPRALAAVEAGVVLIFERGSARLLPVAALLVGAYLYFAAQASHRARQEQAAVQETLRNLQGQPQGTARLAAALAAAPEPERVYETEICAICQEALREEEEDEEAEVPATTPGGLEHTQTCREKLEEALREVHDLERELQAAKAQEAELKRIVEQDQYALEVAQNQADKANKKWSLFRTGAQKQKALDALAEQLTKQATDVAKAANASQRVTSLGVTLERQMLKREELQRVERQMLQREELQREVEHMAATISPGSAPTAPVSSYRFRWPWEPAPTQAPPIPPAPVTPRPKPPSRPVSTLRCGHQFHADCVATWIRIRTVCPTCMQPIDMRRALLEGAFGVER